MNAAGWLRQVLLLGTLTGLGAGAAAQESGTLPGYSPLFSEEMIERAAPEQRERMRAVEEENRRSFERRQREREAAAAPAPGAATPPAAAPASAAPTSRSRIYRWVDDNGRVHFGDAPGGRGAEEVHVGGAARIQGTAPPAPDARGGERAGVEKD